MKKRGRRKVDGGSHRTSFLKSVERTLDVLEFLSKQRLVGITDLANVMKIANSTAHRMLTTLEKKGFAVQDFETGKYALGHKLFKLTRSVIHTIEPMKYVRPYLEDLHEKIGENIAFGIVSPAKDRTLILAETLADKSIIAKPILFEPFPIHVCACGKAYLLTLNDQQLKKVLSKNTMVRFTRHTCTSLTALKKQLNDYQRLGYTLSQDELSMGLSAIAAGICNSEDKFAGAILVAGPSLRFIEQNIKAWGKPLGIGFSYVFVVFMVSFMSASYNDYVERANNLETAEIKSSNSISSEEVTESTSLASLTKNCEVSNFAGYRVKFHDTRLPEGYQWKDDFLCDLAGKMVDEQYEQAKSGVVDMFCSMADKMANSFGGGSYDVAYSVIRKMPSDNNTAIALKSIEICKSKASRLALIKETTLDVDMYSVGTIILNDKTCPAYIQRTTAKKQDSIGYDFYGAGGCTEISPKTYHKNIFHPKNNKSGKRFGRYLTETYKYSGDIPSEYLYYGKTYSNF